MPQHHLATYLNDHLAGSAAALELLGYLEQAYTGTPQSSFFAALGAEVATDRDELKAIMNRLGVPESRPRKIAGWLTEKITQLKLLLDDGRGGPLSLLEAIEAVALGIEGKRALWYALAAAAEVTPRLQGIDYDRLAQRARDQRCRIELARLEAARIALVEGR
jgi:hypothetical protein